MKAQAHGLLSPPQAHAPTPSIRDDHNFEAVFHIPASHYLLVVRSRSRGGLLSGVYWEHEEYDTTGALIARYQSFSERDNGGFCQSGWRKYNLEGRLIGQGEWH
jgi:hypothetical protein